MGDGGSGKGGGMISLTSQIMGVERALRIYKEMGPVWVKKAPDKWTQERVDTEVGTLMAVLDTLKTLRRGGEITELPLQQPVKAPVPGMSNHWVEPDIDLRSDGRYATVKFDADRSHQMKGTM